jgi:hypothetical protein
VAQGRVWLIISVENLVMSEVQSGAEVNVRSGRYYIARTEVLCWHCGLRSGVLALAVPPEHETLLDGQAGEEGDGDTGGDSVEGVAGELYDDVSDAGLESGSVDWQQAGVNAFLFYVEYLPDTVQGRVQDLSPSFRLAYSDATLNSYWANHCDHCGGLLGDHEMHCEPEGAFVPTSETAAAAIELLKIEEPLEAAADGYAFEPEFFSLMREA